jgi:ribosomal 30S subunit maturation factor RimM
VAAARTGDPERVAVGYVAGTKGVRGEVGIEALTWDPGGSPAT